MYWWLWTLLCLASVAITAAITYRLAWWRIARLSARRGYNLGRKVGYVEAMTERRKDKGERAHETAYQTLWREGMQN